MKLRTWLAVGVIAVIAVGAIELAGSRDAGSGCAVAGGAEAHADTTSCVTVQDLAENSTWAQQRIQELSGQPQTTGRLYYPGSIAGFQTRSFTSGYQDITQADQAIAEAGIVPPGRSLSVATHAEVKAAAFMRAEHITYAVLVINMSGGVCGSREKVDEPFTCNVVIPGVLPKGSILAVWSPVEVSKPVKERKALIYEGGVAR